MKKIIDMVLKESGLDDLPKNWKITINKLQGKALGLIDWLSQNVMGNSDDRLISIFVRNGIPSPTVDVREIIKNVQRVIRRNTASTRLLKKVLRYADVEGWMKLNREVERLPVKVFLKKFMGDSEVKEEKMYLNTNTGKVDTIENWKAIYDSTPNKWEWFGLESEEQFLRVTDNGNNPLYWDNDLVPVEEGSRKVPSAWLRTPEYSSTKYHPGHGREERPPSGWGQ